MNPRILKNPKTTVVEFMYGGMITIFQPGETKPIDGEVAKHALTMVNTGLIDVTDQIIQPVRSVPPVSNGPDPTGGRAVEISEVNTGETPADYTLMGLPQLLKLAKSRGIKTKFGMKKNEVIALLLQLSQ